MSGCRAAIVVYESMFGNTEAVARAIAQGLSSSIAVSVLDVGHAPPTIDDSVDLMIVGGPTHAFGMSRPATRADAARRPAPNQPSPKLSSPSPVVSHDVGVREWIDGLQRPAREIWTACFDTRIRRPWVPGSAARAAAKQLRSMGFHMICPVERFAVEDVVGPLVDGELQRAEAWGQEIAELAGSRSMT